MFIPPSLISFKIPPSSKIPFNQCSLEDTVVARTVELDKYWWHGFEISGAPAVLGFVVHDVGTRDGPWGWRRLQDYMTPMLRASETSWHARMPREYARRIVRGRDRSAKKISTPTPWIGDEDQWVKLVGGCGKGERGWIIRIPLSCVRGDETRGKNFAHIHFDLLKIDLYGMNGTKLLGFFFFCSSCKYLLCIFRWW